MNIFENLKHSGENSSNRISEQAAVEAKVIDVNSQYMNFLKGPERQRVILAVDFVSGSFPIKIVLETPITYAEPEYELFEKESQKIFLPNRISENNDNFHIFSDIIKKDPPPITEALKEFRQNQPNTKLECDISFEILQGIGNPKHLRTIERFFTNIKFQSDPKAKNLPMTEIWTVTKLESKLPSASTNTNKSVIPYNANPRARARRVTGRSSSFRGR